MAVHRHLVPHQNISYGHTCSCRRLLHSPQRLHTARSYPCWLNIQRCGCPGLIYDSRGTSCAVAARLLIVNMAVNKTVKEDLRLHYQLAQLHTFHWQTLSCTSAACVSCCTTGHQLPAQPTQLQQPSTADTPHVPHAHCHAAPVLGNRICSAHHTCCKSCTHAHPPPGRQGAVMPPVPHHLVLFLSGPQATATAPAPAPSTAGISQTTPAHQGHRLQKEHQRQASQAPYHKLQQPLHTAHPEYWAALSPGMSGQLFWHSAQASGSEPPQKPPY
jgi:hypothetical protein